MIIIHVNLGMKFLLCLNEKCFLFKKKQQKKHSVIMDFPLQWVHSCETVNEGISITRMGTGRKCSAYTICNPVLILHL